MEVTNIIFGSAQTKNVLIGNINVMVTLRVRTVTCESNIDFLPVRGGAVSVTGGLVSVIIIFGSSPSEAVSLFVK